MLEEIKEKLKKLSNLNELYNLKLEYLGKKGRITEMMNSLKELTIEQKKLEGQKINEIKNFIIYFLFSYKTKIFKFLRYLFF